MSFCSHFEGSIKSYRQELSERKRGFHHNVHIQVRKSSASSRISRGHTRILGASGIPQRKVEIKVSSKLLTEECNLQFDVFCCWDTQ
jgi:hypothetical protein